MLSAQCLVLHPGLRRRHDVLTGTWHPNLRSFKLKKGTSLETEAGMCQGLPGWNSWGKLSHLVPTLDEKEQRDSTPRLHFMTVVGQRCKNKGLTYISHKNDLIIKLFNCSETFGKHFIKHHMLLSGRKMTRHKAGRW